MQAKSLLILVSSILLCAAALAVVATTAGAHDAAQWIADNPRYVDETGRHCCGPTDCDRAPAEAFREAPEGIWITVSMKDVLMPRRLVGRGLYPSIDDGWWACFSGGVPRCIFKPTTGG